MLPFEKIGVVFAIKKSETPTPKVVRARPVTFWLTLNVTVKKQKITPIKAEPINVAKIGRITATTGFILNTPTALK